MKSRVSSIFLAMVLIAVSVSAEESKADFALDAAKDYCNQLGDSSRFVACVNGDWSVDNTKQSQIDPTSHAHFHKHNWLVSLFKHDFEETDYHCVAIWGPNQVMHVTNTDPDHLQFYGSDKCTVDYQHNVINCA